MYKGEGIVKISWIKFENTDTGLKIENSIMI